MRNDLESLQFTALHPRQVVDNASTFENLVDPVNPAEQVAFIVRCTERIRIQLLLEFRSKYEGFKGSLEWLGSVGSLRSRAGFHPNYGAGRHRTAINFDFETPGQPNVARRSTPSIHASDLCHRNQYGSDDRTRSTRDSIRRIHRSHGCTRNDWQCAWTVCCGAESNWEFDSVKSTPIKNGIERFAPNSLTHSTTQFFQPDGNTTDGTDFGRRRARDPRLVQLH